MPQPRRTGRVDPEMWLGLVPTACPGEVLGLDPALMLAGQRALQPAGAMRVDGRAERRGEEVTGGFLMMMCTFSSWEDYHPCASRWGLGVEARIGS